MLFHDYFSEWVDLYKEGAVRPVTLNKYKMTLKRLTEIAPKLKLADLDKRTYQNLINEYAKTHEKQTVQDWHTQLKSAVLDAIDEGLLKVDPTRKVVIKGKDPTPKKQKFLSVSELQNLINALDFSSKWDILIFLIAKTGLRFSEALGLTPNDFDFENNIIHINKAWNYKCADGGFVETKNKSSKRTILIDENASKKLQELVVKATNPDIPIFVEGRIFNSIVNLRLETLCNKARIPVISIHGLRHTHASILLHSEISIASIARRLGHANTTTTQETYLHIIKELEAKDNKKIADALCNF